MRTKDGRAVDDSLLDKWADGFESGSWPKGRTVVLGRPRLSDEELVTVSFKLPRSGLQLIDGWAREHGENRSEFIRDAVYDRLSELELMEG